MTYLRKYIPARSHVNKAREAGKMAVAEGKAITDNPFDSRSHASLGMAWEQGYWLAASLLEEPPRLSDD